LINKEEERKHKYPILYKTDKSNGQFLKI